MHIHICITTTNTTIFGVFINFIGGEKMKRTFQPKKIHRAKKHGFLSRSKSANGRKVIASRRSKGRAKLAA